MSYKIFLNIENVYLMTDGDPVRHGFFTNQFVAHDDEAEAIEVAKIKVLERMKHDKRVIWTNVKDFVFTVGDAAITNEDGGESDQGFVWYEDKQARN